MTSASPPSLSDSIITTTENNNNGVEQPLLPPRKKPRQFSTLFATTSTTSTTTTITTPANSDDTEDKGDDAEDEDDDVKDEDDDQDEEGEDDESDDEDEEDDEALSTSPPHLPLKVLAHIFSFLNYGDLVHRVSLVCQEWNTVSSLDIVWHSIYVSKAHLTDIVERNLTNPLRFIKVTSPKAPKDDRVITMTTTTSPTTSSHETSSSSSSSSGTTLLDAQTMEEKEEGEGEKNDGDDDEKKQGEMEEVEESKTTEENEEGEGGEGEPQVNILEVMIASRDLDPNILRMVDLPVQKLIDKIMCTVKKSVDNKVCETEEMEETKGKDDKKGARVKEEEDEESEEEEDIEQEDEDEEEEAGTYDLCHQEELDDDWEEEETIDDLFGEQNIYCFDLVNSAPLCQGTIEDQFDLVSDMITAKEFKQLVNGSTLRVPLDQIDIVDYPYVLKDRCMEERHKIVVYFSTMFKSEVNEQLIRRKIVNQDETIIILHRSKAKQEQQTNISSSSTSSTATDVSLERQEEEETGEENSDQMDEAWKLGLLAGMKKVARRAGVKYIDPDTLCISKDLLITSLHKVLSRAAQRLEGEDDAEYIIQPDDINQAVLAILGKKLYGFSQGGWMVRGGRVQKRKIKIVLEWNEREVIGVSESATEIISAIERELEAQRTENWFGNGPSFFNFTSFNPNSYDRDTPFDYTGRTEEEIIAHDKREDIEYYGNSFQTEEESNEQVDGTQYHLRRLIRQNTMAVLSEFFNDQ